MGPQLLVGGVHQGGHCLLSEAASHNLHEEEEEEFYNAAMESQSNIRFCTVLNPVRRTDIGTGLGSELSTVLCTAVRAVLCAVVSNCENHVG